MDTDLHYSPNLNQISILINNQKNTTVFKAKMTLKEQGNDAFKEKNFQQAIDLFTQAISENPTDHLIYGNRSASYYKLSQFEKALEDAEKAVELKASWSKGWQRKAAALQAMNRKEEAMQAYESGYEADPTNTVLMKEMSQLKVQMESEKAAREQQEKALADQLGQVVQFLEKGNLEQKA